MLGGDGLQLFQINNEGLISFVAGQPANSGFVDGEGSAARFAGGNGIAAHRDGTLYVTDVVNSAIRIVSPLGSVSTLARNLPFPADIVVNQQKTVFFISGQSVIYRVEPNGTATAITDQNTFGSMGGITLALGGLTLDRQENLLICSNFGLFSRASNGEFTRIGEGCADVAVGPTGSIYVLRGAAIYRSLLTGSLQLIAGEIGSPGFLDGQGQAARLSGQWLAVDSNDNLYLTERENSAIRKISPGGDVSTVVGSPTRKQVIAGMPGGLHSPLGLAIIENQGAKILST